MRVESVGLSEPFHPKHTEIPPLTPFRDVDADACFRCNQKGHWARDCPTRTPSRNTPINGNSSPSHLPQPPPPPPQQYPERNCSCGRPCIVRTSRTSRNPDRDFYTCSKLAGEDCGFFLWCDALKKSPVKQDQQLRICTCKAGPCRVVEVKGVKHYVCYLKKGQGACVHFIPVDSSETSNEHSPYNISSKEPSTNGKDCDLTKGKEKDVQSSQQPIPPKPGAEHDPVNHNSGSPMKRLNFFEGSPSKRTRTEPPNNQKEPEETNVRAVDINPLRPIILESQSELEDENLTSAMRRLSFTKTCALCGEEGHDVIECIAPGMW